MAEHCSESLAQKCQVLIRLVIPASVPGRHFPLFYFFINFLWKDWKFLQKEKLDFVVHLWESSIPRTLSNGTSQVKLRRLIALILVLVLKNTGSEAASFWKPRVCPWRGCWFPNYPEIPSQPAFPACVLCQRTPEPSGPQEQESPVVFPTPWGGVGSDFSRLPGWLCHLSAGGLTGEGWRRKASTVLTRVFFTRVMLSGPTKISGAPWWQKTLS